MQCDSLLAEVENKRSLFLSDLEQEERVRRGAMEEVIDVYERVLTASNTVSCQATRLLETGTSRAILRVSGAALHITVNRPVWTIDESPLMALASTPETLIPSWWRRTIDQAWRYGIVEPAFVTNTQFFHQLVATPPFIGIRKHKVSYRLRNGQLVWDVEQN